MSTVRIISLVLAALVAGCFGSGPDPGEPTSATIVFHVDLPSDTSECATGRYIASVAVGAQHGYAVTLPYTSGNCGGGSPPPTDVPLFRFDKTGGPSTMLATIGQSDGGKAPRLAALDGDVIWLDDNNNGAGSMMHVGADPALATAGSVPYAGGYFVPAGVVVDGAAIYTAGRSGGGGGDGKVTVDDPRYPCCGPANTQGTIGLLATLPRAGGTAVAMPVPPAFSCATLEDCLAANATTLFYVTVGSGTPVLPTISSFPKAGTVPTEEALITTVPVPYAPVGLAANAGFVGWAESVSYDNSPYPAAHCQINLRDLATNNLLQLVNTGAFSCMGLAMDDTHAYFTIVTVESNNGNEQMHGDGIGRVSLDASHVLETIDLGMTGEASGPRRIYLDGTDLYAVDPFVIGKIAKQALVGRHDLEQ